MWKVGPNPNFRVHLFLRACRDVHANLANLIYLVMYVSMMPRIVFSELAKEATLKWFGEIITYHVQSGAVAYVELSSQNEVGDEKYLMLMWRFCLILDALPFISNNIALWLS